jgi:hypothetical protein
MTRRRRYVCATCGADTRARDLHAALAALARAIDAIWRHLGRDAHRRARGVRR